MEGRRVQVDELFCTVRFCGPLQGQEGEWIGVEWDDASRGKNSGTLDGVEYFKTTVAGAGSFLRLPLFTEKRAPECTLKSALLYKYTEHVAADQAELYAHTVMMKKKPIELVGAEKVESVQENIDNTVEVALQSCGIAEIDDFGGLIPRCTSLLLDSNLLRSWSQAILILRQMPQLQTLSLSYNRLSGEIDVTGLQHSLKVLVLIKMNLTWTVVRPLLPALTGLKELLLCKNCCADIDDVSPSTFPELTLLNLEENCISEWSVIDRNFSSLPQLEKLIINNNALCSLTYNGGFPRLTALSLTQNKLHSWDSIHEIASFPAGISELRLQHNAELQGTLTVSMFRFMTVARMPTLQMLNGAAVRPQERLDAERFYLRQYYEDQAERRRAVYAALLRKHGDLSDLGKVTGSGPSTLNAALTNIKIVSLAKSSAGKEAVKKLPLTTTVLAIKSLCSKLFSVPVAHMKLTYRESRAEFMPELLDDNTKELSYYVMREGGELWVEDAEPVNR